MLILRIAGVSFLGLGGLAGVVLLLLPFEILRRRGLFEGRPETSVWLLLVLCLSFGVIFSALGMSRPGRWTSSKVGGGALMAFGFVCALELFLIEALMPGVTSTDSLWWLFVLSSLSGGAVVSMANRAEREAERERAEEARRQAESHARAVERKLSPAIVRLKVRRQDAHGKRIRPQRRRHITTHSTPTPLYRVFYNS